MHTMQTGVKGLLNVTKGLAVRQPVAECSSHVHDADRRRTRRAVEADEGLTCASACTSVSWLGSPSSFVIDTHSLMFSAWLSVASTWLPHLSCARSVSLSDPVYARVQLATSAQSPSVRCCGLVNCDNKSEASRTLSNHALLGHMLKKGCPHPESDMKVWKVLSQHVLASRHHHPPFALQSLVQPP